MVGRTIGKYRVVEQIGRGGMGTVYKAIDETLDRRVAIKVLNADLIDQENVERFRREAMTLAKLNHGRIGAIHELTRDGHDLLMVMEFLEGDTFEKLIERGPLSIPRAVALCAQVLDALQYAHAAGVIHRDLKPANVIVTPSGDIKVMDFGIARVQGSEHLTTNGYMVGTPAYMAPEQVRGEEVDPRMDLYAVAVVLYRMLTQRLPFPGDTAIAMIHSQLNNPPTPVRQFRADLPEWLVKVLDKGLSKAAVDRFQTAAEFRAALESGLTGKMRLPETPSDMDETLRPTLTPPPMRVPAAPSGVDPAFVPPSSATMPSVTPSAVAPVTPSAVAAAPNTATLPPAAAAAKAEATVTLRAPHLATAGILLALLVIGVVILAIVALRRPATVVVAPTDVQAPVETATAPATATDPSATPPSTAGTTDVAAAGTPAPTATPAASPTPPPSGTTTGATSGATPAVPPAPPATAAKPATSPAPAPAVTAVGTTPTRPGAAASATPPAGTAPTGATRGPTTTARGTAAGPTGAATTAAGRAGSTPGSTPTTAVPAPAPSLAANAPAENFGDVKALVVDGTKSREVDALLSLEPGNLVVRSRTDGSVLRTMPYAAVAAATYARAKRPRGQTTAGVSAVPDNLGGSGFLGGDRHWLTLQTPTEFLVIRLEDRNVMRVLSSIELRTGAKVQRTQGE